MGLIASSAIMLLAKFSFQDIPKEVKSDGGESAEVLKTGREIGKLKQLDGDEIELENLITKN